MAFGPVELLVLKYTGDRFTGVPAAKIKGLVDAGFIRIIDVIFARKGEDGEVKVLELNDLDDDEQVTSTRSSATSPASSTRRTSRR